MQEQNKEDIDTVHRKEFGTSTKAAVESIKARFHDENQVRELFKHSDVRKWDAP